MIKFYELLKIIAKIRSKKQADQDKWQNQKYYDISGLKDHIQL